MIVSCVEVWLGLFWDCSDRSFCALMGMCCDVLMDYSDVVIRVASCLPWMCLVACLMYAPCLIAPFGQDSLWYISRISLVL